MMDVMDYDGLRNLMVEAMEDAGLLVKADEVLYMTELVRTCELFVQRPLDVEGTWAKFGFEWRAENQATSAYALGLAHMPYTDSPLPEIDNRVILHVAFHLHFDDLDVGTDVIREVAEVIQSYAHDHFGGEGGVITEVRLLPTSARVECLRFEATLESPSGAQANWWREWGQIYASMLSHFDEIHAELYARFGPSA